MLMCYQGPASSAIAEQFGTYHAARSFAQDYMQFLRNGPTFTAWHHYLSMQTRIFNHFWESLRTGCGLPEPTRFCKCFSNMLMLLKGASSHTRRHYGHISSRTACTVLCVDTFFSATSLGIRTSNHTFAFYPNLFTLFFKFCRAWRLSLCDIQFSLGKKRKGSHSGALQT